MSDTAFAPAALQSAFRTDPGRIRSNNEDLPLVDAERGVYGVVDGVGGHVAGEMAAAIARDVIFQRLARPLGTAAERVREAIALANNEIFRRAEATLDLHGMTCVVTLAVVADGVVTIGHVGDSRFYLIRPDGIRKLTHDHSPVGEREDAGELSEPDAMRHPRRHEVFRDVGSALRDKDEDDYVEVVEATLERDAAILVCSDGLTDMITSAAVERLVRQLAGSPTAVVDALVEAANAAGGRDNVTVVYAEGPDFARRMRGPGSNAGNSESARRADTANQDDTPHQRNAVLRALAWVARSRTTWFAFGALVGAVAALLLVYRTPDTVAAPPRTLAVGPIGTGAFVTIGQALQEARAGDVVRVEPGTYAERLVVGDGVSLVARVPGSVTITRPAVDGATWVAITTAGDTAAHLSGIRIESTAHLPVDVGILVAGQGRSIGLVDLAGPMRSGIELERGAAVGIAGAHFAVTGTALALGDGSQSRVTSSIFLHSGPGNGPAPLAIGNGATATFSQNVFTGFTADSFKSLSAADRQQIAGGNVIVTAEPSPSR